MKIRTAIFGVYVSASAVGFIVVMALVLRDVRLRYVESMRRTLADTAVFLGGSVMQDMPADDTWPQKLRTLPPNAELLRVFACDRAGRVVFDSARGADVGSIYAMIARPAERPAPARDAGVADAADISEVVRGELRVAAPVRRAARTDLCGGRSAMIVPTATRFSVMPFARIIPLGHLQNFGESRSVV